MLYTATAASERPLPFTANGPLQRYRSAGLAGRAGNGRVLWLQTIGDVVESLVIESACRLLARSEPSLAASRVREVALDFTPRCGGGASVADAPRAARARGRAGRALLEAGDCDSSDGAPRVTRARAHAVGPPCRGAQRRVRHARAPRSGGPSVSGAVLNWSRAAVASRAGLRAARNVDECSLSRRQRQPADAAALHEGVRAGRSQRAQLADLPPPPRGSAYRTAAPARGVIAGSLRSRGSRRSLGARAQLGAPSTPARARTDAHSTQRLVQLSANGPWTRTRSERRGQAPQRLRRTMRQQQALAPARGEVL